MDDFNVQFNFKAIVYKPLIATVISKFASYKAPDWKIDESIALQEAKNTNRVILVLFTSDDFIWCQPCHSLQNEVLTTALFSAWAYQRVVLFKIKCSKGYNGTSSDLTIKYKVSAIPQALALDPLGKEIGRLDAGYSKGTGAKSWLIGFESVAKMNSSLLP